MPNPEITATTRWCVHVPGPDDLYAHATREAADKHAADLNAAMARFYEKHGRTENDPADIPVAVIPWPWDADSHEAGCKEFASRG